MTAQPAEGNSNLPYALAKLGDAISALVDPKPQTVEDTICWVDSLYDQLCEEIPGSQGNRSRVPQSSPPLCIDAAELKTEIDTAVACWEPRPPIDASLDDPRPITVLRLQCIENRGWRPQDVHGIDQITAALLAWCEDIQALLNPPPRWHLPNKCPACGVAIVYRKNSSGESVRQPALQIGASGCICQRCGQEWGPQLFVHLARVLGYELPDGVLE